MDSGDLAQWIRVVHDSLVSSSVEQAGATWGPVQLRHRSTRPLWFGEFSRAWARTIDSTSSDTIVPVDLPNSSSVERLPAFALDVLAIDLVSGALSDLTADIDPPAITMGELGARGEILTAIDQEVALVWGMQSGEILGWDRSSGKAICLRLEPPNGYETVSPLRSLVHWSTIASGGVLVHGASIGRHRSESGAGSESVNGLLLIGEAGYGKSTSTLACLERGWVTSGDDAVAIFPTEDGWHATAVYAAVKTKIDQADSPGRGIATTSTSDAATNAIPATTNALSSPAGVVTWTIAGRKRAHLLTSTDDNLLVDSIRLSGIVLLDPAADSELPWQSVSAAAARNTATPSTALPLPYHREEILDRIGALSSSLPCYSLPRRAELKRTVVDLSDILDDCEPEVSVIIPVFNGKRFIDDALASIVAQTVGRLQIIIISDASPDNSIACAEAWRSRLENLGHSLIVIEHATNQGVAQARNTGIDASTSELVAFIDQDDLWTIDHLAILCTAIARSGALVAVGGVSFVDLGSDSSRPWMRESWFEHDHAGHVLGAVLCRRSTFDQLGMLDPQRTGNDDLDWFMRLRDSDLPVVETSTIVLERRLHESNQSQNVPMANKHFLSIVRDHIERKR